MKIILNSILIIICISCSSPKKSGNLIETISDIDYKAYQNKKDSLNNIIANNTNNYEAYIYKAKIDFILKDYSSALKTLKHLEKINDKYFFCYYNQAIVYLFDFQIDNAINYFEKSLDVKKHSTAQNLLKLCYGFKGDYNVNNAYTNICSIEEQLSYFEEEFYDPLSFNITTEVSKGPPISIIIPWGKNIIDLKKQSSFKGIHFMAGMPKNWTKIKIESFTQDINGKFSKPNNIINRAKHTEFEIPLDQKDFNQDSTILSFKLNARIEILEKGIKRDTVLYSVYDFLILK